MKDLRFWFILSCFCSSIFLAQGVGAEECMDEVVGIRGSDVTVNLFTTIAGTVAAAGVRHSELPAQAGACDSSAVILNYTVADCSDAVESLCNGTTPFGVVSSICAHHSTLNGTCYNSARRYVGVPFVGSAYVLMVNAVGLWTQTVKLSRNALISIITGRVSLWGDPLIVATNPNLPSSLLNQSITVVWPPVERQDFLEDALMAFGAPSRSQWVTGVTATPTTPGDIEIKVSTGRSTSYSIAFVDRAITALNLWTAVALLENHDGEFIDPSPEAITAAINSADYSTSISWPLPDFLNPSGKVSWPFPIVYTILLNLQESSDVVSCDAYSNFLQLIHTMLTSSTASSVILLEGFISLSRSVLQSSSVHTSLKATCNGVSAIPNEIFLRGIGPLVMIDIINSLAVSFQTMNPGLTMSADRAWADVWENELSFGVADFALTVDGMTSFRTNRSSDYIMIPLLGVPSVIVYNIPELVGHDPLVLSRDVITKIFFGNITMWNDTEITSLQTPDLRSLIPAEPIIVIFQTVPHEQIKAREVGIQSLANWPLLEKEGAHFITVDDCNEHIIAFGSTPYALSYTTCTSAISLRWQYSNMINKFNDTLQPNSTTVEAALKQAGSDPFMSLLDLNSSNAWPITTIYFATFMKEWVDCKAESKLTEFWLWIIENQTARLGRQDRVYTSNFTQYSYLQLCLAKCQGEYVLSDDVCDRLRPDKSPRWWVVGTSLVFVLLVLVSVSSLTAAILRRRNRISPSEPLELIISDLSLKLKIGEGNAGIVFEALWGGTTVVAAKQFKASCDPSSLFHEAKMLSVLRHPNIIAFYGLAKIESYFLVVTELAEGSAESLIHYWGDYASLDDLLKLAKGTAAGMAFLEKNKIVHGDLALRNVLYKCEGNDIVPKISDFERSSLKSALQKPMSIPVRWAALEVLLGGIQSTSSDVWSFGVLLWELFSPDTEPYCDVPITEVIPFLQSNRNLSKPTRCPEDLYQIMLLCWARNSSCRPRFLSLFSKICEVSQLPEVVSHSHRDVRSVPRFTHRPQTIHVPRSTGPIDSSVVITPEYVDSAGVAL
ncbi:serine/threonine kinase [Pelomyxa schiedti]|nr:serine/threonine kinase [Pelomyxa schiedti]